MDYKLEDLIDIKLFQSLQDKLNDIYKFPSAIIDNEGKILIATAWQDICTKFHRQNAQTEAECIKSDKYILSHINEANPAVSYTCPHGMIDNAVPIVIGGKHLANFFTGQLFVEPPNIEFFKQQAKKYGFNEKEYLEAVSKVPIWTQEKLEKYLSFIKQFTEIIAKVGLKNLKEIENRKALVKKSKIVLESEHLFKSTINSFNEFIHVIDEDYNIILANNSCIEQSKQFGFGDKIVGKKIMDVYPFLKPNIFEEYGNIFKLGEELITFEENNFENKKFYTETKKTPVFDSGKVIRVITTIKDISDHKKIEQELIDQNQKSKLLNKELVVAKERAESFSKLFENSLNEILIFDTQNLKFIYVNKSGRKNLGYTYNELKELTPLDIKDEFTKETFLKLVEPLKKGKKDIIVFETIHKRKDKSYYNVEIHLQLSVLDGRSVFTAMILDITQRVKNELKLKEQNEELISNQYYLKKAQEIGSIGTWELDLIKNELLWTEENYKIFGVPQGTDIIHETFLNCIHPDDSDYVDKKWKAAVNNNEPYDIEHRLLVHNKVKWVREKAELEFDEKGKAIKAVGVTQDITHKKEAEAELIFAKELTEKNEELLNITQNISKVGGWEWDVVNETMFWTKETYRIHEISESKMKSGSNVDIEQGLKCYAPDDRSVITEAFEKCIKNGKSYDLEFSFTTFKGRKIWIRTAAKAIKEKGKVIRVIGNIMDITDRKKAEESLKESELLLIESQRVAGLGSYVLDITTGVWESSNVLNNIFGLAKDYKKDVSGWLQIIHPEDLKMMQDYLAINVFTNHELFNKEYRILSINNQQEKWVHGMGKLEFDDNGNPVKMIGTIQDISVRKKAELEIIQKNNDLLIAKESAEESKTRFKALHNASFGGIAIHDKGVIIDCNLGLSEMTGYSLDELTGMDGLLLIAEDYREMVLSKIAEAYEKPYEAIGVRKNGEKYNLRLEAREIPYKGKQIRTVEFRDITESKKAEEKIKMQNEEYHALNEELSESLERIQNINSELEESKEKIEISEMKYRSVVENMIDGFYRTDERGNTILISPSVSKILGFSKKEIIGQKVSSFYAIANERKIFLEAIKKHGKVEHYQAEFKRKGKKNIFIETNAQIIYDKKGKYSGVEGVFRDISESKKAEEKIKMQNEEYHALNEELSESLERIQNINSELEESKEKAEESKRQFIAVFEQAPISMQLFNKNGLTLNVNKAWEDLWQGSKEQVVNKYNVLNDTYAEKTGWLTYIKKAFKGEVVSLPDMEYDPTQSGHKGRTRTLRCLVFPIKQKERVEQTVIIHQDITEIKKYEAKLKNQNKELIVSKEKAEESNRLKTEFLNNMSHEIRTPMNGILGFSNLLDKENLANEKRKNYVSIIKNSGTQLVRIIDDILEISRLGTKQVSVQSEEICFNDLLLEQFSIFDIRAKENKTPLYLKKGATDNESKILSDETKLNKILSNLLENALKFTNTGYIEFGYHIKKSKANILLEIYVKDTGVGISPKNQKIIFERFSQEDKALSRKIGGLGLGLSIAKENTELLGGKISVESKKGEGATFYISIPYKPVKSETISEIQNNITANNQDISKILIVEDEEVNYLYLETLLIDEMELNCEIIHAKNGEEAVNICKSNSNINLVLMDVKMPIMNGYEATKLIKVFLPNVPIVIQTAYSTKNDIMKANEAGCDDFISKPISFENFNNVIKKYLN